MKRTLTEKQLLKIVAEQVSLSTLLASITSDVIKSQQRKENQSSSEQQVDTKELTRALLLTQQRTEPAIREAIRRYQTVLKDMNNIHQHPDLSDEIASQLFKLFKRYRSYYQLDLQMLGVKVTEVTPGSVIDTAVHSVVETKFAGELDFVDAIAEVITPAFSWCDAKGVSQIVPAEVVAFIEDEQQTQTTPEINGKSTVE